MARIKGVLLDIDGTLLESNEAHARSWLEVFLRHGFEVPLDKVRRLIGKGGDKLLPEAIGIEHDSPLGKKLSQERSALFKEAYLPKLRPTPGARNLLLRLRSEHLTLTVATSATPDELNPLLDAARVRDLVDEQTTSGDAANSKPDPDIIHVAIERSGHAPRELIMLGDTPWDIEAASRGGVSTIAVRCGGWDDAGLAGAVAIYHDPADLLAHYSGSPLGRME
ncbi:MAG TPA: HAD family hydrolase [Pirellulales bacterium]|nr:HAD family hydrolase [Pirellulales bacterium]